MGFRQIGDATRRIRGDLDIRERASAGRLVDFRGKSGYSYASVSHKPEPYTDCHTFNTIFERLSVFDPNVTRDNYTCLTTYYRDGKAHIPEHHDDEFEIVPGSAIYTISIGATRTLRFINKEGLVHEQSFDLPHGSVHCMNQETQAVWAHCIEQDSSVTLPRVSFTLRWLDPSRTPPPKLPVPPIKKPQPVLPSISRGSHHRILFLTDSIHTATPTSLFNRIPGHRVVKKKNYQLVDIFGFEPEFGYSSIVLISCGVN